MKVKEKKIAELPKNKEEDMNACKVILLFVLIVSCWNCAEPEFGIEDEMLPDTELYLVDDGLTVDQLLVENTDVAFQRATGKILNSEIGRKLLVLVKRYNKDRPFIRFTAIPDQNGDPVHGYGMMVMKYAGCGEIRYNFDAWKSEYNDGPLFHEFFHMYQNENQPPLKSRNNEVEAYVAQYLYSDPESSGIFIELFDERFHACIVRLAKQINKRTGCFKNRVDVEKFYNDYQEALDWLANHPDYSGEGWFENRDYRTNYPFPNLVKLLKESK